MIERLRRFGRHEGPAKHLHAAVDPDADLSTVHREHVAELLTVLLRARLSGAAPPESVSLEAVAALGPAVERWGLAAEVALLTSEPSEESARKLAAAILALAPSPERLALAGRVAE